MRLSQKATPAPRKDGGQDTRKFSKQIQLGHQKQKFIEALKSGYTVKDACSIVGWKSDSNYKYHKSRDSDFKFECDKILSKRSVFSSPDKEDNVPDFPEFSEKFLGQRLFNHQLQWYDLLEGRAPRNMHPSQRYDAGDKNFIVINTPPGHSKSTTITQNYVTWRIVKDPSVRIMVVSKTQGMAKKFLHAIQQRLTSQRYADLIRAFAPPDGFDGPGSKWRADQIYVSGIDSGEKDPTVEAVGIGGHIYGARADLIILDDCVTLDNVGQVENQIDWIQQEVMSRVDTRGRMIVVGTRVAPVDLYTELLNPKRYPDEKSAWTYLSQPAVLDMAEDPADWVPLWPYSNQPILGDRETPPNEDGLFPKFTGFELSKIRARVQPRTWAMVYMQQQVDEEAVFPAKDVQGCVDGVRYPGALHRSTEGGTVGHMDKGSEWYVIAGLDPATISGYTACTILAYNRRTHKRRVVDVSNKRMTPDALVNLIKEWTIRYEVDEWRVEKNAFQAFLTQSKEITQFMASRGVLLREHHTGSNKWNADYGVAAMAMLFRGWEDKNNMIELPRKENEGVKALIEQLIVWIPDAPRTQKTDCVMSLWFAELRARELVSTEGQTFYAEGDTWLSGNDREERVVLDVEEFLAAQRDDQLQTIYMWSQ